MEVKKRKVAKSNAKDKRLLSFFDVDARAVLRSLPFSAVRFPPRVGEQIELRAEIEHGGGLYLVVGVRHILEDSDSVLKQSAAVIGMVVDVKPQHAAEAKTTAAMELDLEEIVSVPVSPLPLILELSAPPEVEE